MLMSPKGRKSEIILVGDESPRWNTLLLSLIVLSENLEEFNLLYINNEDGY